MPDEQTEQQVKTKVQKGWYRHYKGDRVKVLGVSQHTETGEVCVSYTHRGRLFHRPIQIFTGMKSLNILNLDTHEVEPVCVKRFTKCEGPQTRPPVVLSKIMGDLRLRTLRLISEGKTDTWTVDTTRDLERYFKDNGWLML